MGIKENIQIWSKEMAQRREAIVNFNDDSGVLKSVLRGLDITIRFSYVPWVVTGTIYVITKNPYAGLSMAAATAAGVGSLIAELSLLAHERKKVKEALKFVGLTLETAADRAMNKAKSEALGPSLRSVAAKLYLENIIKDAKKAKRGS